MVAIPAKIKPSCRRLSANPKRRCKYGVRSTRAMYRKLAATYQEDIRHRLHHMSQKIVPQESPDRQISGAERYPHGSDRQLRPQSL